MRVLVFVILAVLLAGCAPADPLDTRINSRTSGTFLMWRGKIEARLSPAERTELAAALQELKLAAMIEAGKSPASDLDARVRSRINGRPLRELYIEAATSRLIRLAPERAELRQALTHNHQIGGSDTRSAQHIALRIERQTDRLNTIETEMAAAEARLLALRAPLPALP